MPDIRKSNADYDLKRAGKYLPSGLAHEECVIGIFKAKEIIGLMPMSPAPKTPPEIKGVINLRAKVIPMLNLGRKFDLPAQRTCIMVTEPNQGASRLQVGVVVDSASELLNIKGNNLEDAPLIGAGSASAENIIDMAKIGGG